VPVPGWNAHRRPQSPLRQPQYLMKDVPKCARDCSGSQVQEIRDRDHFKEAMAEMVLLCTEAMRRSDVNRCSSKPLSLEYIADRLDVDDPCFGYVIRSKEGMLQGFITVTTFTNWQRSFRWDSLHEIAFYYDDSDSEDEDDVIKGPQKQRKVDRDGSLARELQQTVRLGDPYNEGIVWPRIAEISLLGALGCGRKLVQLVVEQLEFQKATGNANYDYIALQATDNSIPFYESLGFVRVGAVTVQSSPSQTESSERPVSPVTTCTEPSAASAQPLPPTSPEKPETLALPYDIVSSPLQSYEVAKPGETPTMIAKQKDLSVWDIIFLNKDIYKDITPSSRLMKGTMLHLPQQNQLPQSKAIEPAKWFVAKENDTPKKIAKKFSLPCRKLVDANRHRLPELMATSRLKAGTRIKISNLDQQDDLCTPYCHWSFPDDSSVEGGEPSYMMVYKLDRKTARTPREVRSSLAVPVQQYSPAPLLHPAPKPKTKVVPHKDAPKPPPQGPKAVDIFKNHLRDLYPELKTPTKANIAELNERWRNLPQAKKDRYAAVAKQTRKYNDEAQRKYQKEYKQWEEDCKNRDPVVVVEKEASLFNKVIKLREDAPEGQEYSYWFVLTYIPDLKWCHLAPMVKEGIFGPERKRSAGRTRWRLVEEKLGRELDISSVYCIPVRSKALKKTADADKEEWDILDDSEKPEKTDEAPSETQAQTAGPPRRIIRKQPIRARSAIKPMGGKLAVVKPKSTLVSPVSPRQFTPSRKRSRETAMIATPKHKDNEDMAPARKARTLNNAGARRCALQL